MQNKTPAANGRGMETLPGNFRAPFTLASYRAQRQHLSTSTAPRNRRYHRGFSAGARVVLVMNKVTANEAETLGISDPKVYRSLVKVDMGKASRAPDAGTSWLRLEGQSLGNGDGLAPPDFVGVATLFNKPDVFAGMTTWHLYRVQQRLDERDWRDNVQAKDWVGHLVAEVAGLDANADRGKIKAIVKEWKRTGALLVETRTDRKGDERPCIAIGNPVDPSEMGNPHLERVGTESAESAEA